LELLEACRSAPPVTIIFTPLNPFEARLHHAREQMRELLEAGEIDWQQLHDESVLAFACEDDEAETSSRPELALAA
jgi:hypothetical protein